MTINIAIDGPSGAGKSTAAKLIAKKRNILYLDTGAMYRGVGYFMRKHGADVGDAEAVERLLPKLEMEILYRDGEQRVFVNGEDVTPFLRDNEISMAASTVSKIPAVRLKLVEIQRGIAGKTDCVLDGRDIGTFVLPNARYKFYVTATPEERARRRFLELNEKGCAPSFERVLDEIVARDRQDTEREFAPLRLADDAIVIDTTGLTADEVLKKLDESLWKS